MVRGESPMVTKFVGSSAGAKSTTGGQVSGFPPVRLHSGQAFAEMIRKTHHISVGGSTRYFTTLPTPAGWARIAG